MNSPKMWTEAEVVQLKTLRGQGKTYEQAGRVLGRTAESCRLKLKALSEAGDAAYIKDHPEEFDTVIIHGPSYARSADGKLTPMPEPKTVEQDRERSGNDFWKREYKVLEKKYETVLKERSAIDQLVDMASELAPRSYDPSPNVYTPNRKGGGEGKPQSAVLMLSDTHIGQVVEKSQTLGFGRYDFPIFLARLKYLEESVASILQDHTTTKVEELVVCLGGDMLNGNLNHGAEAGQKNTLFTQFYAGGHALAQFLRNVAPLAPKVRVYCTVGNHTRWGTQHKMPTENRYSNFDQVLYAYIQALTSNLKTVEWNLDTQPFALFDVQGFQFHLSHGDHLRGGDKALGIPNHSVGRMVSSTAQLFGKKGQPSPHYFLVGHLHRSIALPHARGSVLINGGFAGIDGYGLSGGFSPVDPSQTFFLVHPKFGKTATYDIWLQNAVQTAQAPYEIPGGFPVV